MNGGDAHGPQFSARAREAGPVLGGAELTHFRAPAPLPPPPACGGEQRGSGGFCQWPKPPGNLLGVAAIQTFAVLPQSATY